MARNPWYKWYVKDWRSSPKVRRLSAEARGVWRELLDVMHESGTYEVAGTIQELARDCALMPDEIERALKEIETSGVANVPKKGGVVTVVSRRLLEEHETREYERKRKKSYREKKSKEESPDECPGNVPLSASASASVSASSSEKKEAKIDFDEAWNAYAKKVDKQAAAKAWKRLKADEREAALNHIPVFVEATPEKQFRPHFASYLNGRRWEDEELPERNGTTKTNGRPLTKHQAAAESYADRLRRQGFVNGQYGSSS